MNQEAGFSDFGTDTADPRRIFQAALRRDMVSFTQKVFATVSPGDEYQPNWHIDAIALRLQQCLDGEIKRLIITVPPRSLKSICVSVAFPAWVLGHDPTRRIICASYSGELARKHALDFRAVMKAPWYKGTFPGTRLDPNKDTELEVMTTRRGFRLATSVYGTLTGRGGNFLIVDDAMNPKDAMSKTVRETTKQWYDGTLYSRLDNKAEDVIIVVMQRLHVDDLVAHLLEKEEWDHLNIPALAECDEVYEIGPGRKYRRRAGEALHPEREPLETLEIIKANLGSYNFAAQYQQDPVPAGGGMIKWEWFPRYHELPEQGPRSQIVQSWDTASKAGELNDYSVCTTWLVDREDAYLIDVVRARLEYPDLKKRVRHLADEYKADAVLIEDKGSGSSLIQDLRTEGLHCIAIEPEGDKVTRMSAVSARIEAGHVHLPERSSWMPDFETEVLQFPYGRFDDQVDSMSQFLNWHRNKMRYELPPMVVADFYRPSPWRMGS